MIKATERPASAPTELTLAEAAETLGVHYMTAYKYVRTGRLAATKVGGGWRISKDALDEFRSSPSPRASGERVDWSARLGDRLTAGDEAGAWNVIEASMASGLTPISVYLDVLAPSLAAIGAGWAVGEVSIAEEHRATAVTNRLIGRLGPQFNRPGQTRGTIVIGAVAGDQHAVPIAMAADLLRGRGFTVIDLGADSPIESFIDAATSADRLVAVGISSSTAGVDDNVIATADALRDQIGCPIVIGGHGIEADARRAHADAITTSANDMLEAFDRIARDAAEN
jgi:excisionase family DNA binding protein